MRFLGSCLLLQLRGLPGGKQQEVKYVHPNGRNVTFPNSLHMAREFMSHIKLAKALLRCWQMLFNTSNYKQTQPPSLLCLDKMFFSGFLSLLQMLSYAGAGTWAELCPWGALQSFWGSL